MRRYALRDDQGERESGHSHRRKAFDAQERVIEPLEQAGTMAVIPPKANRKDPRSYDRDKARQVRARPNSLPIM